MKTRLFLGATATCLLVGLWATSAAASEFSSFAIVQDDGSLRVDGRTVQLYGIYIPSTASSCRTLDRPVTCASRAALALDFKIGADFVHCQPQSKNEDGSVVALCWVGDQDLGSYLLERGWAVALPDAPYEYTVLEKIARHQGIGVWGLAVERRR